MVQSRQGGRGKPTGVTYTLPELARHWKLSWAEFVDRLCDPDTRVPVFADTTILAGDRDCHGRLRKFGDGKLLQVTGREVEWMRDSAGNKWILEYTGRMRPPDLERVRDILTGPPEERVFLQLQGTGELFCDTRRALRSTLRVKVIDVKAYAKRPVLEAQERGRRARGGPPAAEKVHKEHVETKVKPYREEYRRRLCAGEKSPEIIADMAQKYDQDGWAKNPKWATKRIRDMIKPRQL